MVGSLVILSAFSIFVFDFKSNLETKDKLSTSCPVQHSDSTVLLNETSVTNNSQKL